VAAFPLVGAGRGHLLQHRRGACFDDVRAIGGEVVRPPEATDWGGYNGYFADPDGHLWEVAHNPNRPIGPDGRPALPRA
jgi:uncharacterized protein